jgi:murein DD-endopeptidase MepM/ murein hydrolase activator NlpD
MYKILADLPDILAHQKDKGKKGITGWKYGYRIHPIDNTRQFHNGIDLPANEGTPISCPFDGQVVMCMYNDELNGNALKINHAECSTAYAHMFAHGPGIIKGAKVKAGQVIGFVGTTGKSTGAHLHFVIRVVPDGKTEPESTDPLPWLESSIEEES